MEKSTVFHGPNAGYILELYDQYLTDPESVSPETKQFFDRWTPPADLTPTAGTATAPGVDIDKIVAAVSYVSYLRRHGHLGARLSSVTPNGTELPEELKLETYGLSEADLETLPASVVDGPTGRSSGNAREAIQKLRTIYSGTIGYEFNHVQDKAERDWLRDMVESGQYTAPLDAEAGTALLDRLTEVEGFEKFLHQTYLGQKRFSIEGLDTLVPMLDEIIHDANQDGVEGVVIGMAHRGRLNVLAHILGKPYSAIVAEFEHLPPPAGIGAPDASSPGYSGDVKYHLGWHTDSNGHHDLPVLLSPNPSHLEFVDPVVEGIARARQDSRDQPGLPPQNVDASLPILLHGDAAFPGEGIAAETLNLSKLPGYTTGGTVHIITNNQLGFTTEPDEGRSTRYASDLAKGFDIPIVHVNADDALACIAAARMAIEYRQTYHKDFMIDLIGYRRWGHNEGDEPGFTQPRMYEFINQHPTARAQWARHLEETNVIPEGDGDRRLSEHMDRLLTIRNQLREDPPESQPNGYHHDDRPVRVETEVEATLLAELNDALHSFPEDFTLNSKLNRQLQRRQSALEREGGIDWAHAESLSFASLLAEGVPIRMVGQDTVRGTFSQRHLALHDPETGMTFTALQSIPQAKASFAVYNSPLSEAAALGFEYGYSVGAPEALVLWEAQFGDFVNSAQVIIDQFIAAAEAKWQQNASLVLLLPHGYEGQGPEHSSARLERFLQLAANDNIRVANCSTAGQYFHLLRRQARMLESDPRPLIVMTPKSLLRHSKAGASLADLAAGAFQPVIDDPARSSEDRNRVERIILCSGKVYVDLASSEHYEQSRDVAVVRVEELYPFPAGEIQQVLESYPNTSELVWLQEEPQNMGAWRFVEPRLRELAGPNIPVSYIGRPEQASPAEGSNEDHVEEQTRIVNAAFATQRPVEQSIADD